MTDIDKILKQFGGDATNISINFIDGKWRMDYNGVHTESADSLTACADGMLAWYRDKHTYKRAAEEMWLALDLLACDENPKVKAICERRHKYITMGDDGNLVWNPSYHESVRHPVKDDREKQDTGKPVPGKPVSEPVKVITERDEYPDYFIVADDDVYSMTKCWGYDVNGVRTRVIVDRKNPKGCSILSPCPPDIDKDKLLEIGETEYNNYYDEAARLIAAAL